MNPMSALMCAFLCVCLPQFFAPPAFPLIGLQRGSKLAGSWPADHTDDPSPTQTLWEATATCPPLQSNHVSIHKIPPSPSLNPPPSGCITCFLMFLLPFASSLPLMRSSISLHPQHIHPSTHLCCRFFAHLLTNQSTECIEMSFSRALFPQSVVWVHLIKRFLFLMMAAETSLPWQNDLPALFHASSLFTSKTFSPLTRIPQPLEMHFYYIYGKKTPFLDI